MLRSSHSSIKLTGFILNARLSFIAHGCRITAGTRHLGPKTLRRWLGRPRDVNKARGVKVSKPRPETCKAKATDPRQRPIMQK